MHKYILLIVSFTFSFSTYAIDSTLLYNNKETRSRELSKKDFVSAENFGQGRGDILVPKAKTYLEETINAFLENESACDMGAGSLFKERALSSGLIQSEKEYPNFLKFLRSQNLIDDLFYRILSQTHLIQSEFKLRRSPMESDVSRQFLRKVDLVKTFEPFKTWVDDVHQCSIARFSQYSRKLEWKNRKERDEKLAILHQEALKKKLITEETYRKLETFRIHQVTDWNVYVYEYTEVLMNAKDKLAKEREVLPLQDPKYADRKEKLTQRTRLYQNYDSTQIVVLAELIGKTAKRMDALQVTLNFEYKPDEDGEQERETYIFSPMEQYRISINMLRKEMAELMRSDSFRGKGIEFEDLVAAAFETGLIRSDELDYILKFEDFWNPQKPRWRTYSDFAFSVAGTASFYLPPPWNILGAIALVVTQSKVNGKPKPDPDDNWNVII